MQIKKIAGWAVVVFLAWYLFTQPAAAGNAVQGHAAALRYLATLTLREAQTQTYGDVFLAIMACFAIATLMVPLMRKVAPPKAPPPDAH